jgi:hypothetical protein
MINFRTSVVPAIKQQPHIFNNHEMWTGPDGKLVHVRSLINLPDKVNLIPVSGGTAIILNRIETQGYTFFRDANGKIWQ